MIENNRRSTTREIAEKLNISHTCVERNLKQLGYVNKLDIWVPHKLNEIKLTRRIWVEERVWLARQIRATNRLAAMLCLDRHRHRSRRGVHSGKALSSSTREMPSLFNLHRFSNTSTARRMHFSREDNASLESRKCQFIYSGHKHTETGHNCSY